MQYLLSKSGIEPTLLEGVLLSSIAPCLGGVAALLCVHIDQLGAGPHYHAEQPWIDTTCTGAQGQRFFRKEHRPRIENGCTRVE